MWPRDACALGQRRDPTDEAETTRTVPELGVKPGSCSCGRLQCVEPVLLRANGRPETVMLCPTAMTLLNGPPFSSLRGGAVASLSCVLLSSACRHLCSDTPAAKVLRAHPCCKQLGCKSRHTLHSRRVRMLEKRIEAIRKAKHGYPPAELECVFAEARAALSRSKPLQPCLSHFVTEYWP